MHPKSLFCKMCVAVLQYQHQFMAIELFQLDESLVFPHPKFALEEPNGLLAFGGDLSIDRLLLAYKNGIFPWYSDGEPIMWWSPSIRTILRLDEFRLSSSMRKFLRKTPFSVTVNRNFQSVIEHCAFIARKDNGTWITDDMIDAYLELHQANYAHSIEVWDNDELVGGLYGVVIGQCFCGESMFHKKTNASKLAMAALVHHMQIHGDQFIDCQMQTAHLTSLGATEINRNAHLSLLKTATSNGVSPRKHWQTQILFQQNQFTEV